MPSEPPATVCARCDERYAPAATEPHRCSCGGPLEIDATLGVPEPLDRARDGLAAMASALPGATPVDLGAGGTPLIRVEEFRSRFKLEYGNPTGSFKDRGAAMTAARARDLGVDRLREDSSGNAARALAAHAASADLSVRLFVPAAAGPATISALERTGAEVVAIEGDRHAVEAACLQDEHGWYASHAWRPSFYAGTATLAFELVAQGTRPIRALVMPVGHGTLLLGVHRGFRALERAGAIDECPRLIAVQPADGGSLIEVDPPGTKPIAPGVRIAEPARRAQVEAAIDDSGGRVVPVEPATIERAHRDLHGQGFAVCSTSALALAGRRLIDAKHPVVVLTGRDRGR